MATKPANGYVPANALVEVDGVLLERATAAAYLAAKSVAAKVGVTLRIALPAGGYRSYDTQYRMKQGIPSYAFWNIDPAMKVSLAAPGQSSHGWGICVDIVISARAWAIPNMAAFGFSRPFGNNDPGHFLFGAPTWAGGAVVLKPNERMVLATGVANRRIGAPSRSAPMGAPLPASTIGTFDGWIHGENVNGNDVWLRGAFSGDWFWSGGMTDPGTHDLADLNPAQPAPKPTRTIRGDIVSARIRDFPTTVNTAILGELLKDQVIEVLGYTDTGEAVTQSSITSSVWIKIALGWVWAGSLTTQDVAGLEKIVVAIPPTGLDPAAPWKSYPADLPDVARWIGSPNYNRYPSTPKKNHITDHWMVGTLAGTDATFQNPGTAVNGRGSNPATNFGVGQVETHQYIRLQDYQHGDGDRTSNTEGWSIEHEGGPTIPITDAVYANSAKLHAALVKHPDWIGGPELIVGVNLHPHKHWVATSCPGDLDLERIAREANALNGIVPPPPPPPGPEPVPEPVPGDEVPGWFSRFLTGLAEFFTKFLSKK